MEGAAARVHKVADAKAGRSGGFLALVVVVMVVVRPLHLRQTVTFVIHDLRLGQQSNRYTFLFVFSLATHRTGISFFSNSRESLFFPPFFGEFTVQETLGRIREPAESRG